MRRKTSTEISDSHLSVAQFFFPLQKFSGKQKWQLTKISYRSCELKFSRQNLIFPSFAWKLSGKTSEPPSFSPMIFLRYLETKKNRRWNVICRVLSIKVSSLPEPLRNTGRFLMKFFNTVSQKLFDGKTWYPPLSSIQNFCYRETSEAPKSSHWNFLVMWDKTISTEERDIPFYQPNNFSLTKVFWNTEEFPMKHFGNVRRRNFDGKTWYPPLIHKLFQYQNFSENLNGPPKNFSALSDEKSRRKFVIPPSRLAINFLPLQKFSGKQKAQLMKFFVLVLWGKIFSTKPNAPRLMHKNCRKKI